MRVCDNEYGVAESGVGPGFAETGQDFVGASGAGQDFAGASGAGQEVAAADELISDLAALLDAGLVVAHEHVLGPARYGLARHPGMIGGAVVD